jgi:hypothetical protein
VPIFRRIPYLCNTWYLSLYIVCILYSDSVYCALTYVYCTLTEVFLTLTEVFPCFFLSCKANARVNLAKTGHGPYSATLVVIRIVRLLVVLFFVLFVCKCVLPSGDNPIAVNKYIISYRIISYIVSYHDYLVCRSKLHTRQSSIYSDKYRVSHRYCILLMMGTYLPETCREKQ